MLCACLNLVLDGRANRSTSIQMGMGTVLGFVNGVKIRPLKAKISNVETPNV